MYSWANSKEDISLESLFKSTDKLCFLAGSGISHIYPSCQPTGRQYTEAILKSLIPQENQQIVEELVDPEEKNRFLRFEQLMEYIQQWDPDLHILDRYGLCDQPNSNHISLAQFLIAGHKVFTSNFDNLIEHGLLHLGVPHNMIRPAIMKRDWEIDVSEKEFNIYKLHGSLFDFRDGTDCRKSVRATIRQISQNKDQTFELESWKKKTFEKALKDYDLIVVGYSGLDDFDILPTIADIKSDKRILWIEHDNRYTVDHPRIEVIVNKNSEGGMSRINHFLTSLVGEARSQAKLIKIRIDTKECLRWLSERYFNNTLKTPDQECPAFILNFPSCLDLPESKKWYFVGYIYSYFNPYKTIEYFKQAILEAREENDIWIEAKCLNFLGRQFESLIYRKETSNDEQGKYFQNALTLYKEALKIFRTFSEREGLIEQSSVSNNIGALYRILEGEEYVKTALEYYNYALSIDNKIGNLEGQSRDLNNIGAAQYALGNLNQAIQHCETACKIDRKLGDLHHLAAHLGNLGKFYLDKGNEKGISLLNEAIEIGKQLGSIGAVANCLNHLGLYYGLNRKFKLSCQYYEEALHYAVKGDSIIIDSIRRSLARVRQML